LLRLAADGVVLDGFTTDVAGYEFVRNALKGLGGVAYHPDTVSAFLDGFAPLFDPENVGRSSIGRDIIDKVWTYDKPVGAVVDELTGRSHHELLTDVEKQQRNRWRANRAARRTLGGADIGRQHANYGRACSRSRHRSEPARARTFRQVAPAWRAVS
jgi:hypothetical protein